MKSRRSNWHPRKYRANWVPALARRQMQEAYDRFLNFPPAFRKRAFIKAVLLSLSSRVHSSATRRYQDFTITVLESVMPCFPGRKPEDVTNIIVPVKAGLKEQGYQVFDKA